MADARSKGPHVRPITPRIIRKSATVGVNYSLTITLSMVLNGLPHVETAHIF